MSEFVWHLSKPFFEERSGVLLPNFNPVYTGGLFHCYMLDESICHFRAVRSIGVAFVLFLMENPVSKRYRP